MWVCTNKAFLSAVEDRNDPTMLVVRARVAGHIKSVFPTVEEEKTSNADYLFRAWVSKKEFAEALVRQVTTIDYPNFKDSVKDRPLHDAYMDFWHTMYKLQSHLSKSVDRAKAAAQRYHAR